MQVSLRGASWVERALGQLWQRCHGGHRVETGGASRYGRRWRCEHCQSVMMLALFGRRQHWSLASPLCCSCCMPRAKARRERRACRVWARCCGGCAGAVSAHRPSARSSRRGAQGRQSALKGRARPLDRFLSAAASRTSSTLQAHQLQPLCFLIASSCKLATRCLARAWG